MVALGIQWFLQKLKIIKIKIKLYNIRRKAIVQDKDKLISQMILAVKIVGLYDITPVILSDGGNLIVHLAPHPIVARVAVFLSEEDTDQANKLLSRELCVARYLHSKGVPVLLPSDMIDAGPHRLGGTWMTF